MYRLYCTAGNALHCCCDNELLLRRCTAVNCCIDFDFDFDFSGKFPEREEGSRARPKDSPNAAAEELRAPYAPYALSAPYASSQYSFTLTLTLRRVIALYNNTIQDSIPVTLAQLHKPTINSPIMSEPTAPPPTAPPPTKPVSISPLLLQLADPTTTLYSVPANDIAAAVSLIFSDSISPVQTGCLLYALHTTQLDRRPDVLAACASSMRDAAAQVDAAALKEVVRRRGRKEGHYMGGLVWYAPSQIPSPSSSPFSTTDQPYQPARLY